MSSFSIAPLAQADIDEIWDYIAADNPPAADRWLDVLYDKFLLLASQPLIGQIREELSPDLRSFSVDRYVLYYKVLGQRIRILRVLHGARDIEPLF